MKCEQFEARLVELARGRGPDDAEARAHAESCPGCAARLAAQREVTAALGALASSAAASEAPARVEAALLAAFDERRRPRPLWTYAAAAALVALAFGAAVVWRMERRVQPPAVASRPAVVAQPVQTARLRSRLGTEPVKVSRKRPTRRVRRPAPPVVARSDNDPLATGYITLVDDSGVPETGPAPVVRMRLPRSVLVSFGLPMSPDPASETVDADVVLNDAGVARAIRFVR